MYIHNIAIGRRRCVVYTQRLLYIYRRQGKRERKREGEGEKAHVSLSISSVSVGERIPTLRQITTPTQAREDAGPFAFI